MRATPNISNERKPQPSWWFPHKYKRLTKLEKQIDTIFCKKIIVFDLDGTLTESKANLDQEMAALICKLLENRIVAVTGGWDYPQLKKQFLACLRCPEERLKNLFILPTSGGRLYTYHEHNATKWQLVYKYELTNKEKKQIYDAFEKAFRDINYTTPKKTYGKIIEDRESQITFSALGQKAPLTTKKDWNKKHDMRPQLKSALKKYLPGPEIRLAGLTSIDITRKGIDKAYGIKKIAKLLSISIKEMVYIGDALFEGGNDFAVVSTGIDTIQVSGPVDVKRLISKFLKNVNYAR